MDYYIMMMNIVSLILSWMVTTGTVLFIVLILSYLVKGFRGWRK